MKDETKKEAVRYIITAAIALLIAWPVATYRGMGAEQSAAWNARCLSDGFFTAGLLLTGLGALIWISTTGFFDMFSYAFHSLLVLFSPLRKPSEHESFFDYKQAKDMKRGKPLYFMVIVGVACLLVSVICLVLYYKLPAA